MSDHESEFDHPPEQRDGDYAESELFTNRTNIVLGTLGFIVGSWIYVWLGDTTVKGGVGLTVIGVIVGSLLLWLFGSEHSTKIDENSAGMGKTVKPRTMGTILGYFYNGFRN